MDLNYLDKFSPEVIDPLIHKAKLDAAEFYSCLFEAAILQ